MDTVNFIKSSVGVRTFILFYEKKPYLYCCPSCGKENTGASDTVAIGRCAHCGLTKKDYVLDFDNKIVIVTK